MNGQTSTPTATRDRPKLSPVVKATGFGHLGVFPEQEGNWRWLQATGAGLPRGFRALNLFAYTGSATVYGAAGGAATTTTVAVQNHQVL